MLHKAGDPVFPPRLHQEVNVVGHQAKSVNPHEVTLRQQIQPLEVCDQLDLGVKDFLFVVTSLIDVVNLATTPIP